MSKKKRDNSDNVVRCLKTRKSLSVGSIVPKIFELTLSCLFFSDNLDNVVSVVPLSVGLPTPGLDILFLVADFFIEISQSYFSETQVSRVILTAGFNKHGLNIDIRLKNRHTGNFSKTRFFIGGGSSGQHRDLRH